MHTAGPWAIDQRPGAWAIGPVAEPNVEVATIVRPYSTPQASAEAISNARLIACAPDLLAFAEHFKRLVDDGVLVPKVVNNGFAGLCAEVCKVIKDATGAK